MNLDELMKWHAEQGAECRREGEEEARAFHLEAVEALKQIASPAWLGLITREMVEGWKEEAVENLIESLDIAVENTVQQVCGEYDEDIKE